MCFANSFLALAAHFNAFQNGWYWIGLTKLDDVWEWDNREPVTYTNWGPGQPDGCCHGDAICVFNNVWETPDQWNDWFCDDPNTSPLCEIESMFCVVHWRPHGFIQTVYFNNKSDFEMHFQKPKPNSGN